MILLGELPQFDSEEPVRWDLLNPLAIRSNRRNGYCELDLSDPYGRRYKPRAGIELETGVDLGVNSESGAASSIRVSPAGGAATD